ncbi:alpha/beta fold hydrolase [Streptomyces sp. MUM 136J]|uniref:alpha/beta fold hydrolase n=1 Tax=Streptomyces sp. MUM 136J TaxID=2791992 RepID=UPI001F045D5A|nr:alpha/beta hydrolase [Streptomyces sp. MUM 136J]
MDDTVTAPTRSALMLGGRCLSYLDFGGPGRPLLALHGLLDQGSGFAGLARSLTPAWRVIAPDQRGHGESDRAPEYSRQGFVADAAALLEHLGLGPTVVLGHSLGGLNALQLAAWRPDLVEALIVEDVAVELRHGEHNPLAFLAHARHRAATRDELLSGLGPAAPHFADAPRRRPDGTWELPFHPQDALDAERLNEGDHWADWLASSCPVLYVHGTRSQVVTPEHAREMGERRPHTTVVALDADHFVHAAAPDAFTAVVRGFLDGLATRAVAPAER